MAQLTPTCVWRLSPAVVIALDEWFGEPIDAYVNGSQTWLRDDGPGGVTIEWRLHPVARFRQPLGVGTHELFAVTALAVATGTQPPAPLDELWDGLEAFPAYRDETEPAPLAAALTDALGLAPDATGLADHALIGDAWERAGGNLSVIDEVFRQLEP
ncbi:hypothetical protein BH18ACT4_BH18ACT4_12950 [soil metagenome]